jgi:hypothetical protein
MKEDVTVVTLERGALHETWTNLEGEGGEAYVGKPTACMYLSRSLLAYHSLYL